MALVVKDRVKETTATTGTGTLTLAGALTGFQSFSSALSNGDTTYYAIFESSTGEWEVGLGTFTASGTTLARTTVLASSNSGSAVNLTAGSAEVFITEPAGKSAYFDASGDLVLNQDPTSALQAATKQYVDTIAAAGLHYHDPVRVEQEGNLTVTYNNGTNGVGATLTNAGTQAALVIDGVTMVVNDRVLIYEQTDQTQNGVYTVTNVGSASTNWVLTRATDADSYGPSDPDALGQGDAFFVSEGAAGAGETYVMTTEGTITFGTTNITFSQISSAQIYSAGDGLTLTGTTFAAGAGTGVTVNANDIAIGQDVGTTSNVTFNQVTASLVGNVTGNVSGSSGSTTGNAATATALQTGRTISLTGDVTGTSGTFDGTGNVSIAATIAANSVALGTDTTGNYVSTGAVSGNGLSGSASAEGATFTVTSNATNANTASTIVFRDGSGNFSAGTITANLTGTASEATNADTVDSLHASQFLRSDASDSTSGNLTVNGGQVTVTASSGYSSIEMGGPSGAYIDLKAPSSDDYDGRIQYDGSNFLITTNADQPVQLRHNNSTKLATTSSGIAISGNASVNGGNLYVGVNDSVAGTMTLYGAGTGTSEGAEIRLHASADYDGVIEHWNIDVNQDDLRMFTNAGQLAFYASPNAAVQLFYNGSKKFETTDDGIAINKDNPEIQLQDTGTGGTIWRIANGSDGNGKLTFNDNDTERVTFTSGGNVGIGTNSPETSLHVAGGDILLSNNQFLRGENSVGGNSTLIGRNSSDEVIIGDSAYANPIRIQNNNYVNVEVSGTQRLQVNSSGIDVNGTTTVDTLSFSDGSSQTSAGASTGKAIAMAIVFG